MNIKPDKETIAIVVVCYNRLEATKRLLNFLLKAEYPKSNVPLIISVDCSGNEELYQYAKDFVWPYGDKIAIIREERLGLKKHIYECGDLTQYYRGVIILEDDLFVSPAFYTYTCAAVDAYENDPKIAGIALYADNINGYAKGVPLNNLYDGSDGYIMQSVITSGECFTESMWKPFREWYKKNEEIDPTPYYMPEQIKAWRRAWSKYFNIYIVQKDLYFVHPTLSVTSNCGDPGEHSIETNNFLHVRMLLDNKTFTFKPFEESVRYDSFGNYIGLGKYLGIDEKDLCVDLYGNKNNKLNQRYWLTPYQEAYKIEKSFSLILEPMEANVIYNLEGKDLFLYDTSIRTSNKQKKGLTYNQLSYHIKGLDYKILLRYLIIKIAKMAKTKIKRLFK